MAGLLRRLFPAKDPYWDDFVNRPLADPQNMVVELITASPGGGVFAAKIDVHDAKAMRGHMIELAHFWGADIAGVTATDAAWLLSDDRDQAPVDDDAEAIDPQALAALYPHTIVCGVVRDFGEDAKGMGGRLVQQKLAVANFNLRSYIREIGFRAVFVQPASTAQIAAEAGLGTVDRNGRLSTPKHGDRVLLGTVVITDLPMQPNA